MQKFIKKIIYFVSIFAVLITAFCLFWFQYYSTPLPNLSNSISLNAKVWYLKNISNNTNVNVIALGSSMSLNNINSNAMVKAWGNENYLNVSSWGLNMQENFNLLKLYFKKYNPKTIIISSNYIDFRASHQKIKYNLIHEYLESQNSIGFYFKAWNFKQYIMDSREYGLYKTDRTNYQSLKFDKTGGVNYPKIKFNLNVKRWNGSQIKNEELNPSQYFYLDSIAKFCFNNRINLVFVQSPFRQGYYSKLKPDELTFLNNHNYKVKEILFENNAIFINANNETWDDSLFVDFTHLSEEGSLRYTEYFLNKLKKENLNFPSFP